MARVLGLAFVVFFVSFLAFTPRVATAAYASASDAWSACVAEGQFRQSVSDAVTDVKCVFKHDNLICAMEKSYGSWGTDVCFGLSAPADCSGRTGQVWPVVLPGVDSLPGPTYSTDPGGFCQCIFSGRVLYQGGGVSGQCQGTGRLMGDYGDDPAPAADPPLAPESPSPPCGGGSCYDPGTNQFCAINEDGEQVCVPGPNTAPPDAGKIPQTCVTSGAETVCAGTPKGPMPDIGLHATSSVDDVVQTSDGGTTVYTGTVTVIDTSHQGNNEDPGDGSTSTGKLGNGGNNGSEGKADSAGQCSDGRTPSAGGCGAGYADRGCDSPPTCSGDPLLCAGVKEQHATRCAQAKQRQHLADVGAANADMDARGFPAADADPSQGDYVQSVDVGGEGGPSLDDAGWGLTRTCPIESKSFLLMGQSVTIDYGQACGALSLGSILVMIMAYLAAARILFFRG